MIISQLAEDAVNVVCDYITWSIKNDLKPTAIRAAESMNISKRTLQRRLASRNTSFKALLSKMRESLSTIYMVQGYSITQVAYTLQFNDVSSFCRAFRRWKGCSFLQFKKQYINASTKQDSEVSL